MAASANRSTEARKLSQLVRGELDWIVMKSLEKDRTRRYETPSAFAADVHRYLNDEALSIFLLLEGWTLRLSVKVDLSRSVG